MPVSTLMPACSPASASARGNGRPSARCWRSVSSHRMTPLMRPARPSPVTSSSRYARRCSSVGSTPTPSRRRDMVPGLSSAARMPRPPVTSAAAVVRRSWVVGLAGLMAVVVDKGASLVGGTRGRERRPGASSTLGAPPRPHVPCAVEGTGEVAGRAGLTVGDDTPAPAPAGEARRSTRSVEWTRRRSGLVGRPAGHRLVVDELQGLDEMAQQRLPRDRPGDRHLPGVRVGHPGRPSLERHPVDADSRLRQQRQGSQGLGARTVMSRSCTVIRAGHGIGISTDQY